MSPRSQIPLPLCPPTPEGGGKMTSKREEIVEIHYYGRKIKAYG
jgi:hypothetical protein